MNKVIPTLPLKKFVSSRIVERNINVRGSFLPIILFCLFVAYAYNFVFSLSGNSTNMFIQFVVKVFYIISANYSILYMPQYIISPPCTFMNCEVLRCGASYFRFHCIFSGPSIFFLSTQKSFKEVTFYACRNDTQENIIL